MTDDTILWISIGSVAVGAVAIIVLANYLSARSNQRRADKMMRAKADGTYDKSKKYMGDQGSWETDEYSDTTNAPPK